MRVPTPLAQGWCARGRTVARLLAVAIPLTFSPTSAAQPQPPLSDSIEAEVRGLGDPQHLDFTGNASFSSADLRQALILHARFLTASRPGQPLEAYLTTLREEILAGYQRSGFPQVQVHLHPEPATERVRISIHEGPRVRCGGVRVMGTRGSIARQLIACLTERANASEDPAESPRWRPGEPACFDPASLPILRKTAEDRLAALGWFFPELVLRVQTGRRSGVADLIVDVHSLGPPGTAQAFSASGNRHSSTGDILRFLKLKPGTRVTLESLSRSEAQLRNSGRFLTASIKAEQLEPSWPAKGIRLAIQVREYDPAPPLLATLSAKQRVLLQACDWLSHFGSRSEDAVLTFAFPPGATTAACNGRLVLSPRRGAVLHFDNTASGPTAGYALLISRSRVGVLDLQHARKLLIQAPDLSPTAWFNLAPNPPGDQNPFELTFGLGWQAGTQGDEANEANAPVLSFQAVPAAFLYLANESKGAYRSENGNLIITNRDGSLKASASTGRILAYDYMDPDSSVALRFRDGEFDPERRTWETEAFACSNSYLPEHPMAGLASFFGGELSRQLLAQFCPTNTSLAQRRLALTTLDRLLSASVFAPLDVNNASESDAGADAGFSIPKDEVDHALEQSGYPTVFPWLVARYCGGLCSWGSWPARLLMEAFSLYVRQSTDALPDLRGLSGAPNTGPVSCLVAAELADYFKLPVARTLARRGLQSLTTAGFRADCRPFLDGDSGLGRSAARMCAELRELSSAEVDALANSLPPIPAGILRQAYQTLRANPSQRPDAFLGPFLDVTWNTVLRPRVEVALRKIEPGPP